MDYQLLPIGSVVKVKDKTTLIMVAGYLSIAANESEKIWDYSGVFFPEGIVDKTHIFLFDHEQIDTVVSYGYMDSEQQLFVNRVLEVRNRTKMIMEGKESNEDV